MIEVARVSWDYFTKLQFDFMITHASCKPGAKVCDVGCGDGRLSVKLAANGCLVVGLDIAASRIQAAHRLARLLDERAHFCVADAGALPFACQSFDLVVCNCSLEHFEDDDLALEEMSRILVNEGTLVMTVDSMTYQENRPSFVERHRLRHNIRHLYSSTTLESKLSAVGFQIEKAEYHINSPISAFLYRVASYIGYRSRLLWMLSLVLSPFLYVSDRAMAKPDGGYQFAAKAVKLGSPSGHAGRNRSTCPSPR